MYRQVNVNFFLSGYLEQQCDFMCVLWCAWGLMWLEKKAKRKEVSIDKNEFPAENPGEHEELHPNSLEPSPTCLVSLTKRFLAGQW